MALTKDILTANAILKDLTPEQIAAITTLSTNDEATVIGARIGELHGQYDTDVLSVVGVSKNQGEKSYDYVKRVLGDFKAKAESSAALTSQIDALTQEKLDLAQKLKDGSSDETLKQQLADTTQLLADTKKALTDANAAHDATKTGLEKQMKMTHVDYAFAEATNGLKFKSTIPDSVRDVLIKNAKTEILSEASPDFVEENGKKSLVFRDAEGKILSNTEKLMAPFTVTDLVSNKLKDVIDAGRKQPGGGTKTKPGKTGNETLDLSGAKTQVEADNVISAHLMASGLTRQDPKFAEQQKAIRSEAGVDKMPIK